MQIKTGERHDNCPRGGEWDKVGKLHTSTGTKFLFECDACDAKLEMKLLSPEKAVEPDPLGLMPRYPWEQAAELLRLFILPDSRAGAAA